MTVSFEHIIEPHKNFMRYISDIQLRYQADITTYFKRVEDFRQRQAHIDMKLVQFSRPLIDFGMSRKFLEYIETYILNQIHLKLRSMISTNNVERGYVYC